jgi:SAM-dependent methyltransferase
MAYEKWTAGDAYEAYMGRWSRRMAVAFVRWLGVPAQRRWLDVGCGTGALAATVVAEADPAEVVGVDPSEAFVATARDRIGNTRATFQVGDAQALPVPDSQFDSVVSGLVLNFVPEPSRAVAELRRAAKPGGAVAAYVWDYAEGMEMLRHFWAAAAELDPTAVDEGLRFSLCRPDPLRRLWTDAGLDEAAVDALEVPTVFADFDDYWSPFLGGQGPAPGYTMSLTEEHRQALRESLHGRLPSSQDGSIQLTARAWAVRGSVPK